MAQIGNAQTTHRLADVHRDDNARVGIASPSDKRKQAPLKIVSTIWACHHERSGRKPWRLALATYQCRPFRRSLMCQNAPPGKPQRFGAVHHHLRNTEHPVRRRFDGEYCRGRWEHNQSESPPASATPVCDRYGTYAGTGSGENQQTPPRGNLELGHRGKA
jgi:hypothetical protein